MSRGVWPGAGAEGGCPPPAACSGQDERGCHAGATFLSWHSPGPPLSALPLRSWVQHVGAGRAEGRDQCWNEGDGAWRGQEWGADKLSRLPPPHPTGCGPARLWAGTKMAAGSSVGTFPSNAPWGSETTPAPPVQGLPQKLMGKINRKYPGQGGERQGPLSSSGVRQQPHRPPCLDPPIPARPGG